MTDPTRMALARAALLSLSFLSLSCGGEEKPKIKDPPQAMLSVPQGNVAGSKLPVQVGATGCEKYSSLSIYDGDVFLKSIPFGGGGMVPVDLLANEINYAKGVAAHMSLRSRVVCEEDKRENYSQAQPATFFPVAEVVEPPAGSNLQVVPDYFVTEGSGSFISFIGCGNLQNGLGRLFRVDKNGLIQASVNMPFPCTAATVVTHRHPGSGKRWVWTPNGGAIAVDQTLQISGQTDLPLDLLAVGSDGDAIVYDAGGGGTAKGVYRIPHEPGLAKWAYSPPGFLINTPVVNDRVLTMASISSEGAPSGKANLLVTTVDYGPLNSPNAGTGGVHGGTFTMRQVASEDFIPTSSPPATFSPDGTTLYLAIEGLNGLTTVYACATNLNGCTGAGQKWQSPPTLERPILATAPFANNSRVAAVAAQHVWILDASNGAILNKNQTPLSPEGALVVNRLLSGGGSQYPTALFLLNSSVATPGLPPPMPLEIVATEDASQGELFRYQISSGSMSGAVDDAGVLWLRVGPKLIRPLPLGDYRKVRP